MSRKVTNHLHRLNEFPPYKGEYTCVSDGYILEFAPTHHLANSWGWVAQHRLVGEDIVGRPLRRSRNPKYAECVHHKDEDRLNNHPSNLEVMTISAHRRHHARKNADALLARLTIEMAVEALDGRTIKEAAKYLRCHPQTLRNRFPDLIAPRKRASPSRIDDPRTIARIQPYARSDQHSLQEASKATNISPATIVAACRHHGIEWTHKRRSGRPPKSGMFRTKARASKTAPDEPIHAR